MNTDDALPHQHHSDTSFAAAEEAEAGSGGQRRAVRDLLLLQQDGLIDEEIQHMLHMNPSTERPRRIELVKTGIAQDSGRRRNTSSGRKAVVWQLTIYAAGEAHALA